MFKELLKYMVIGVVAGIASYLVIIEKPVSIKINEISSVNNLLENKSYNYIYEGVKDSVVTVRTDKGRGSGVIVTDDGHIVTNEHVIKGARELTIITLDNEIHSARIVGVESITDIALLKSNYKGKAITFSDSSLVKIGDSLEVNQAVILIDNRDREIDDWTMGVTGMWGFGKGD